MSCRSDWGELARQMEGPGFVPKAGVDGALRCKRASCSVPINQATGKCLRGHDQDWGAQSTYQRPEALDAVLCALEERTAAEPDLADDPDVRTLRIFAQQVAQWQSPPQSVVAASAEILSFVERIVTEDAGKSGQRRRHNTNILDAVAQAYGIPYDEAQRRMEKGESLGQPQSEIVATNLLLALEEMNHFNYLKDTPEEAQVLRLLARAYGYPKMSDQEVHDQASWAAIGWTRADFNRDSNAALLIHRLWDRLAEGGQEDPRIQVARAFIQTYPDLWKEAPPSSKEAALNELAMVVGRLSDYAEHMRDSSGEDSGETMLVERARRAVAMARLRNAGVEVARQANEYLEMGRDVPTFGAGEPFGPLSAAVDQARSAGITRRTKLMASAAEMVQQAEAYVEMDRNVPTSGLGEPFSPLKQVVDRAQGGVERNLVEVATDLAVYAEHMADSSGEDTGELKLAARAWEALRLVHPDVLLPPSALLPLSRRQTAMQRFREPGIRQRLERADEVMFLCRLSGVEVFYRKGSRIYSARSSELSAGGLTAYEVSEFKQVSVPRGRVDGWIARISDVASEVGNLLCGNCGRILQVGTCPACSKQ